MKRIYTSASVLVVLLFCACVGKHQNARNQILTVKNIRSQYFVINPDRDTVLAGLRGGQFSFTAGTFGSENPVKIEIKEVYSPLEILYAGLVTESNGQLLESGGMIYLDARNASGKRVEPLKPIRISIPTNYINDQMQLFRGEERADGSIDWVDPEPLDTISLADSLRTLRTKGILQAKCFTCHDIFRPLTGPPLAGMEERVPDRKILRDFIRNPGGTMALHPYFQCLKSSYGSVMTAFPDLTDDDIDGMVEYVKNEAAKRPDLLEKNINGLRLHDSAAIKKCLTENAPCGLDTLYVDTTFQEGLGDNMVPLDLEATKADSADQLYKAPEPLEKEQRLRGFNDIQSTNGRYNFTIKTLGWFNVDAFYRGLEGSRVVDLFVKADYDKPEMLMVHVFFPAKKLLTVGVYHSEDGLFHFEKYKGQIPLFPGDEAVVFATASKREKMFYGISAFTVKERQTISVTIKEASASALANAFQDMKLDGISLDVITKKRVIIPRACAGDTVVTTPGSAYQ